ncbi:hypothetical protein R1flu_011032 [Riccia fluitans]|uniref:C2H2-type domain-containing protein n=1 Tax=Riccia fluitans TaxID=41844 RepID=A0ABD1Z7G7_9MARC
MNHESSSGKTKLDSSPTRVAPRPAGKREEEEVGNDKVESGSKLADLCDEDKAKVARLINQVLVQPDKYAQSFTPTAEKFKAGFPVTALQAGCSNYLHDLSTMNEGACDRLPTAAETGSERGMGVENQGEFNGNLEKPDVKTGSGLRGKENQFSEQIATGDKVSEHDSLTEQQKTLPQRRRPLPRPLPDLVVNILHAQKEVMTSANRSTVVNTSGEMHESGSTNAGRREERDSIDNEGGENEAIQCSEATHHKYSGESDESFKSSKSKKKLRFDPTAGEEGEFYYASDLGKSVCENSQEELQVRGTEVEDREAQHQQPPAELTCSKCIQPNNKTKAARNWENGEVHSPEDPSVFANRQIMSLTRRGDPAVRDMGIPGIIYVTSEDHGPEPSSQSRIIRLKENHYSAGPEAGVSDLRARHAHLCVKCSTPFRSKLRSHHQHRKKEWNEEEMRPNYGNDDTSLTSPISESLLPQSRCVKSSSYILSDNLTSKPPSTRAWNMTVSEEEDSGANSEDFHSRTPSGKQKLVKGKKRVHKIFRQVLRPTGRTRSKGDRELLIGARADDKNSGRAVLVYDTSDDDSDVLPPSAFRSTASGRSFPVQFSLNHRRAGVRYDNKQRATAVEDEGDQGSETRSEKFQVNHEKFETLSESETGNSESLKCSSLVDETIFVPSGDQGATRESNCCRASAEGRLELGSKPGSCTPVMELKPGVKRREKTPITLPKISCKASKPSNTGKQIVEDEERAEAGDIVSQKISTNVENLLSRFIRSNEECAAELIKCFKSKVAATQDSRTSKRTFPEKILSEGKAQKLEESKVRERDSDISTINLPAGKIKLKQTKRCLGCLAVMKDKVSSSEDKIEVEVNEKEILCGRCSTSEAILQNLGLQSPRSRKAGENTTPDPRSSADKHLEANAKQGCTEARSPTLPVTARGQDHEIPSAANDDNEGELEATEEWHIGMFDISLLHLVKDLEVEEIEYWNQINTPYGNSGLRKCDDRRKPWVLGHGQAYTVDKLYHPKRNAGIKHFR